MENWDDLRFVVALARYGTMSKAALYLRTNTATVSRRIKRLNETTNTLLFQKSGAEWELTTEGRRLFELAAGFSDDLRSFHATTPSSLQTTQTVRVTALDFLVSTVLSKSLNTFTAQHPNVTLELSGNNNRVSLAYGEADIALRLTRPTEGRLVAHRIADIRMGIYGPRDCPRDDWIGLTFDLDWTPEMKNGLAFFAQEPKLRLSSFQGIMQAIRTTGQPGILPEVMATSAPDLELLQPSEEMRVRELWLLYHETRKEDAVLRSTCRWLEQSFASFSE
ncbi:LysR family transcriptional regulator [Neptunicoccus sediminis]|uniref:LysR family transcriptional regulator n=1 Tax=Neptunicoccus sediminis TaxID=1892596 RepID=UPI0008461F33|nr:LysR family transcriptional regulator [Neptunicoccus sediminis]